MRWESAVGLLLLTIQQRSLGIVFPQTSFSTLRMRIASITATNVGPFSAPFKIEIDPKVTIITGSNDAGKTSVLKAIRLLFSGEAPSEDDVNRDYVKATYQPWQSDTQYTLVAACDELHPNDVIGLPGDRSGNRLSGTIERILAPNSPTTKIVVSNGSRSWDGNATTGVGVRINVPSVVSMSFDETPEAIRSIVPLDKPNSLELALLQVAFEKFNLDKFRHLQSDTWEELVSSAQDRLNDHLRQVLPASNSFQFRLRSTGDGPTKLAILLRDQLRAQTPFSFRGSGARKMITIIARLLVEGRGSRHRVVLIDEPENSLHADAQHLLREFLYDLCRDGKTQVVYSTHSPCMINPLRPTQVRLLERKQIDGVASTIVVSRPEELGFASVRASWGLSPLDSLLYGPVTVIVEGPTEVSCIPVMCEKLRAAGIDGFVDQSRLLGLSFFLDGIGASHRSVAKIAERQGTKVVLLLDGDNNAAELERRMIEEVPSAKVITLPKNMEFEQLVPESRYFEALAAELNLEDGPGLQARFATWLAAHPTFERHSFSKKVGRWLEAELPEKEAVAGKRKPDVMWRAVNNTVAGEFPQAAVEMCRQLLTAISAHLYGTSFAR